MKFSAGYQLREDGAFLSELLRQKERIGEVYFSYGGMPNGRHTDDAHARLTEWEARRRTDEDLTRLAGAGFAFNLLLNANCYGGRALSKAFLSSVGDCIDEVSGRFGLASVTTTSPVLARFVRANFPALEVRASVNIGIGSPAEAEYLGGDFGGYYAKREYSRDLRRLTVLRDWCRAHGKKLYLLANGGCLYNCPARVFHDNLVAHERELREMDNALAYKGQCAEYFARETDRSAYLRRLSFIRPEDVPLYEGLADGMKLATRVHRAPEQVLRAYCAGRYTGNLLSLLEPDHAAGLYPSVIENSLLPGDFGKTTLRCGRRCEEGEPCGYCASACERALVRLDGAVL